MDYLGFIILPACFVLEPLAIVR